MTYLIVGVYMCKKSNWIMGLISLVVGIIVIPRLIKVLRGKIYKKSLKKDEIDFDNLAPEIVKKDKLQENKAQEDEENGD